MAETISIYQELIPLSDRKYERPISKDEKYTNPIIMPFAFNSVGSENILETVFYIKNESQEWFYKDLVISLMTEDKNAVSPVAVNATLNYTTKVLTLNGSNLGVGLAYEYANVNPITLTAKYMSNYTPITGTGMEVSVKFSYGYDELSQLEWDACSSILVLPQLGTIGMPDTSYKPIRMRIKWNTTPSMFTIRKYFLDLSYSSQNNIAG